MGWSTLKQIVEDNRKLADAEASAIPAECPVCGEERLQQRDGVLNCPMGHWRADARR